MSIVLNRTRETVTGTPGTGNITLAGAVSGHQTFYAATNSLLGRHFFYWAEDGTAWETGVGHLSASTTLVRDTLFSSSTGALLNLSSATEVFSESPAAGQLPISPYLYSGVTKIACPLNYVHGASSGAVVADRLYYTPYLLPFSKEINGVTINVNTVVGTKVRVGIYEFSTGGIPGTRIVQSADVTTSATGLVGTWTPVDLAGGWYYVGFISDGADNVDRWNGAAAQVCTPLGPSVANGSILYTYAYETISSWTELPASPGALTYMTNQSPKLLMRAS